MTTYANREVVVRRVEFAVGAGSSIGDHDKVKAIAWRDYCRRNGHDPKGSQYDDWCTVHPCDEEIVFAFEVEHKPTAAEEAVARARKALTALAERWTEKSGRLDVADFNLIADALDGAGVP